MSINEIQIDGQTVVIGDYVGFKSDIEQSGQVVKIERAQFGTGYTLHLKSQYGFIGEYIGGELRTSVSSTDVWL